MGRAMTQPERTVPVTSVLTTGLELTGAALLTVAGWLAFGLAGLLAVLGAACLVASYAITRGGSR